jgi:membrane glycosyltransferase
VVQAVRGEPGLMSGDPSGMVLELTLALLFGPKLLGIIHALGDAQRRRALGGAGSILRSVLVDVPLSTLAAPGIALTQTIDLIGIATQRKAEWHAQNRRVDGLPMAAILPRYRWHVLVGALLLALSPLMPAAALWLSPVTAGLLLSPLIVQWTASERWGARAARAGVFVTDAGRDPPPPVPAVAAG